MFVQSSDAIRAKAPKLIRDRKRQTFKRKNAGESQVSHQRHKMAPVEDGERRIQDCVAL